MKQIVKMDEILNPVDALGNLLQWAVGNRGSKEGNPYGIPEIKAALQTLAKARGWSYENIKANYYDAADNYRLAPKQSEMTVAK